MLQLRHKALLFVLLLLAAGQLLAAGALSERTYKRLTVIHQLIGDGKYDEALERLDDLVPKSREIPYEYATVMQTLGYAYAAKDQYPKAVEAFREALDKNALPEGVQLGMRYNIAQLYGAIPDNKKAAAAYEEWFALAESPSADTFVFAASIYAQLKDYDKAIPKIKSAISMSEEPKEGWYQLLLAMYYERKEYKPAAAVLEILVSSYPEKKKYWKQLAAIYFTTKRNRKALATLELANKRKLLDEERELMNLVNMYLYQNIPYKAAVLLEMEIKNGRIEASGKNLQKLAEAWMRAQESEEAIDYMLQAAEEKRSGTLFLRASQLFLEREQWPRVLETAEKAIAAGDLKDVGTAYLLRGMAYYELGKRSQALAEFQKGVRDPKTQKQANQWIAHINTEAQ